MLRVGGGGDGSLGLEQAGGNDVDRTAEQSFQLDIECGEVEEIGSRFEVDEEIDVAGVVVLTSCEAADYADIGCLVGPSEGQYLVAVTRAVIPAPCRLARERDSLADRGSTTN